MTAPLARASDAARVHLPRTQAEQLNPDSYIAEKLYIGLCNRKAEEEEEEETD